MFHYKDGWFFTRQNDGSVLLECRDKMQPDGEVLTSLKIDADSWCSVIASMSDTGETHEKWLEARKFHGV